MNDMKHPPPELGPMPEGLSPQQVWHFPGFPGIWNLLEFGISWDWGFPGIWVWGFPGVWNQGFPAMWDWGFPATRGIPTAPGPRD